MNLILRSQQNNSGFTLLEAISTLSISSIILAIAVPSFATLMQSNRMVAARNNITAHLNLARSEAIKRGINVVMCPSTDGLKCEYIMKWDDGFIMFLDNNESGRIETGEELLRYFNTNSGSIRISTTTMRRRAVYDAYGFSHGRNVTFTFCDTNNRVDPKAVIVSNTGRARLSSTKYGGDPLDCS